MYIIKPMEQLVLCYQLVQQTRIQPEANIFLWIKLGICLVNFFYDSKLFTWRTLAVNGEWLHVHQLINNLKIKWSHVTIHD